MHRRQPTQLSMRNFISGQSPVRLVVLALLVITVAFLVVYLAVGAPSHIANSAQRREKHDKIRGIDAEFDAHEQEELEQKSCCRGHLVMVPGHGVFRGADFTKVFDEQSWALEAFQLGQHIPESIVMHIAAALKIVAEDPDATLIFSGGQSRPDCVARSEGGTYMDLVVHNVDRIEEFAVARSIVKNMTKRIVDSKKGGSSELVPRRMLAEEFARDSYENLLFSVCRYFEYHGVFPERVTVVGFPHKRERFTNWHRVAMRWPGSKFKYIGVQAAMAPTASDGASLVRTQRDPYLCRENRVTRLERNPNRMKAPYLLSVPASVRKLLRWCGPAIMKGFLPWSKTL